MESLPERFLEALEALDCEAVREAFAAAVGTRTPAEGLSYDPERSVVFRVGSP